MRKCIRSTFLMASRLHVKTPWHSDYILFHISHYEFITSQLEIQMWLHILQKGEPSPLNIFLLPLGMILKFFRRECWSNRAGLPLPVPVCSPQQAPWANNTSPVPSSCTAFAFSAPGSWSTQEFNSRLLQPVQLLQHEVPAEWVPFPKLNSCSIHGFSSAWSVQNSQFL